MQTDAMRKLRELSRFIEAATHARRNPSADRELTAAEADAVRIFEELAAESRRFRQREGEPC